MVRAVRYITERLPVLIQAVCFFPSGESARTLFESLESKLTLSIVSNKQNRPHRGSHTEPPRGPTPLATSVCERIFFHFCLTTVYNPRRRCRLERNETSERIELRNGDAMFRRLPFRDSPSSQPPSLQKVNFGTASLTTWRCTNYSVLPESRFCHTFCTLGLKCIFKFIDIQVLSSGMETPCSGLTLAVPWPTVA